MTWMRNLYETYENNSHLIGEFEKKSNDLEYALLPVAHSTQMAHIEVTINIDGNFIKAKILDKKEANTIIPCTESSANRTSKPVPHPLHDKLLYVAKDYAVYGDIDNTQHFDMYINQLKAWCESDYSHPKVISVFKYLSKGRLIGDLINAEIIPLDEEKKLIEKWDKKVSEKYSNKPAIFNVVSELKNAFVRFAVHISGDPEIRLWRDKSVFESFIGFYEQSLKSNEICYVSGNSLPSVDLHPSGIRYSSDKAKLISANDTTGFTYRGRFKESKDAVTISYEVSQKAHNALKWLITKQGFSVGGRVFVIWGNKNIDVPNPLADSDELGLFSTNEELDFRDLTDSVYANQINRAIAGYKHDLQYNSKIIVLVLDAATTGRMAIVYYREFDTFYFLEKIENWHKTCYWLHRYKRNEDYQFISFIGAPSTKDIAFAAYGHKADEKLIKNTIERLLPCILDGRPLPIDVVRNVFNRIINPVALDNWEWEKTLSIGCALIRKMYEKEGLSVSLDENYLHRDYLFGRLLAIADVLERSVLDKEEQRATNAIRYMNAFAQHPCRTWKIIQSSIQPYQTKYGEKLRYFNKLIDEIASKIKPSDFNDKPLSGLFLLGFYSQRHDLYKGKNN